MTKCSVWVNQESLIWKRPSVVRLYSKPLLDAAIGHNLLPWFLEKLFFSFEVIKSCVYSGVASKQNAPFFIKYTRKKEKVTKNIKVVITTAQLHSTKPGLRFCAGSNPARGVFEIHNGEDLWQWSRLEIRLNAFRRSTIPQKQFFIIIIIIIIILNGWNRPWWFKID